MKCVTCGSSNIVVNLVTSNVVCSQCGMSFHIDGRYYDYYDHDYF